MMYIVYILRSEKTGRRCVGSCGDLDERDTPIRPLDRWEHALRGDGYGASMQHAIGVSSTSSTQGKPSRQKAAR